MRSRHNANPPITVKRYARSRLYDTVNLRYVTVEMLLAWSAAGTAVAVIDAETGEDVTRVLLA
jgi:polyhydroxyalkanoate synthesis regulator protein